MRGRGACALAALLALVCGCAGGAPLLHPAHVLEPGMTTFGAGLSGRVAIGAKPGGAGGAAADRVTVAPGVAPFVNGRLGLAGHNELGLTYTGRTARVDARHAFQDDKRALSIGVGGSAVAPQRPGEDKDASGVDATSVYGGGFDVPIVVGARSDSDLYAGWIGARAGAELLSGTVAGSQLDATDTSAELRKASLRHIHAGGLAGLRVGFRHVYVAIEVDAAWHHATIEAPAATDPAGTSRAAVKTTIDRVEITPSGALTTSF